MDAVAAEHVATGHQRVRPDHPFPAHNTLEGVLQSLRDSNPLRPSRARGAAKIFHTKAEEWRSGSVWVPQHLHGVGFRLPLSVIFIGLGQRRLPLETPTLGGAGVHVLPSNNFVITHRRRKDWEMQPRSGVRGQQYAPRGLCGRERVGSPPSCCSTDCLAPRRGTAQQHGRS